MDSLENIWSFFCSCGDYENCERIRNQVIDLRTKVLGENHSATLDSVAAMLASSIILVDLQTPNDLG
jgi:hypothetical protein